MPPIATLALQCSDQLNPPPKGDFQSESNSSGGLLPDRLCYNFVRDPDGYLHGYPVDNPNRIAVLTSVAF